MSENRRSSDENRSPFYLNGATKRKARSSIPGVRRRSEREHRTRHEFTVLLQSNKALTGSLRFKAVSKPALRPGLGVRQ